MKPPAQIYHDHGSCFSLDTAGNVVYSAVAISQGFLVNSTEGCTDLSRADPKYLALGSVPIWHEGDNSGKTFGIDPRDRTITFFPQVRMRCVHSRSN